MPGQTQLDRIRSKKAKDLQWRAGQLPGQTVRGSTDRRAERDPSMEGRTIARPDDPTGCRHVPAGTFLQWRAGQLPGQTHVIIQDAEGILYLQWRAGQLPGQTALCELCERYRSAFNGGPDNCPARPARCGPHDAAGDRPSMEGRTIARPDRGGRRRQRDGRRPSMEGRTIARPDFNG